MKYSINILNKHKIDPKINEQVNSFYIGRGTPLGNPYTHLDLKTSKSIYFVKDRDTAIKNYKQYFLDKLKDPEFKRELKFLLDQIKLHKEINLICWCSPAKCHGSIIKSFLELMLEKEN